LIRAYQPQSERISCKGQTSAGAVTPIRRRHCSHTYFHLSLFLSPYRSAAVPSLSLYQIFVYVEAVVHEQPLFYSPRPPALFTLAQYYCTIIGQYTTPLPTSRLYAIHHTIFVITISYKGQPEPRRVKGLKPNRPPTAAGVVTPRRRKNVRHTYIQLVPCAPK